MDSRIPPYLTEFSGFSPPKMFAGDGAIYVLRYTVDEYQNQSIMIRPELRFAGNMFRLLG